MRLFVLSRPVGRLAILALLPLALLAINFSLTPKQSTASAPAQTVPAGALTVLRSDETGYSFELVPPSLEMEPVQIPAGEFTRLTMNGYGQMRVPGQPDLPQTTIYVALPADAEPVLRLIKVESETETGVRVLPGVYHELTNPPSVTEDLVEYVPEFDRSYAPDSAIYSAEALYQASDPVTMGEVTWIRDQRVVPLTIRPVQAHPADESLTYYDFLQVAVDFTYPDGPQNHGERLPDSPGYETHLAQRVLNYEDALAWRTPPPAAPLSPPSPCLGNNAFRLELEAAGMYKLTYADLAAAGLSGAPASNSLRMCNADSEIRIRVEDGGNGTFGSGDAIYFFGEALRTQETTTNVYWFTYGGAAGLRMIEQDNEAGNPTMPDFYARTIHLEDNVYYREDTPLYDANDHWYYNALEYFPGGNPPGEILSLPFNVANKAAGTYEVMVEANVFGGRLTPANPLNPHAFEVRLNGQLVGLGQFNGDNNFNFTFNGTVSSPALLNNNMLTIETVNADNNYFYIWVDWVKVTFHRELVAQNNMLLFTQEGTGEYEFSVSDFSGNADVYNVTDPKNPFHIINPVNGGGTVTFGEDVASSQADYALASPAGYLSPLSVVKDTPSNWRSPRTADYIIITDPALNSALTPLRQLHQGEGLTVVTVYVRDIFDEFGYGIYSTAAIQEFLQYAYDNWSGSSGGKPTYVLLAGEGSYDHNNYSGDNGPGDNLVPVYLRSGVDPNIGETIADNRYVPQDGSGVAMMQLGRLPAKDTTELSTLVNKILTYEAEPFNVTRHASNFFVADNAHLSGTCEFDLAGDFFAATNRFINEEISPFGQIVRRVYYAPVNCYPNDDYPTYVDYYSGYTVDVQERVRNTYSAGQHFVAYTGHSGTLHWGKGNELYLHVNTVPSLTNGDKLSIMLPMTCLEGRHAFPADDEQSLSETLMRSTVGGAVASYAPTGLQVLTAHDFLIIGFYDALFNDGQERLGEAVLGAKSNLADNGPGIYQDLQDTFTLLGDPAMKVKVYRGSTQVNLPVMLKQ